MKLSEAIRIGAQKRPQGFGTYFTLYNEGSCTLGAAYEATVGVRTFDEETVTERLEREYHILSNIDEGNSLNLQRMIVSMNDVDRWTREQIADWLEEHGY